MNIDTKRDFYGIFNLFQFSSLLSSPGMNLQSSDQHSWHKREENGAQTFKKILILEKNDII